MLGFSLTGWLDDDSFHRPWEYKGRSGFYGGGGKNGKEGNHFIFNILGLVFLLGIQEERPFRTRVGGLGISIGVWVSEIDLWTVCIYSWFLLFMVVMFYNFSTNTGLANTESLFLGEIKGFVPEGL